MDYAYSPYKEQHHKKSRFKLPKINIPKGVKKWVIIIFGAIFALFFIAYLFLGQLRFFANHYFGLTFFSKNYIILLQNNYEIRPGGGFITGYGNLDFFMGFPRDISFKNSYDIDTDSYITPPYPHEELLKNEWYQGYTFRDANWDPDFRNSAEDLIGFYQKKYPDKHVDGIFVINFSTIEDLVGELGGVELNGKKFTKENLFSELEFEVNNIDRHNIEALAGRKNILGDLASVLIKKSKRHPFKLKNVLVNALNNKDFYIWLKNPRLQKKLAERGWANVLELPERSDFLAVNLANLGSKKADRYMQTEVNYYANITKEVPEITTEVTIRYPGFTNTYSDNYKGYMRIYIPKTADIESSPVDSSIKTEGEFKVIGAQVILPAGSKMTLTYIYTLPRALFLSNQYKLRLIKQSGAETFYRLIVESPDGKFIQSDDFNNRENRAVFAGYPGNDVDFSLKVLPDSMPPYPIVQEFIDMNRVNITWNEPIDPTSALNAENYTIADMNRVNEVTDIVKIKEVRLIHPNVVEFLIDGVTKQDLEHYRIDLQGIKDMSGNIITPNPKSITVVQRFRSSGGVFNIKLGEIPADPDGDIGQPAS